MRTSVQRAEPVWGGWQCGPVVAVSTSAPQCRAGAAVQGAGLACPRLSQVLSQTGEAAGVENRHTDRQRGGCRGMFKFEGKPGREMRRCRVGCCV